MTTVMTPSESTTITAGQIDKAVAHYRDMLNKHQAEIGSSEAMQQMLGKPDYLAAQLGVLRKHIEAVNVLSKRGHADILVGKKRVPKTFFKTRKGLWVWDGFRESIAARAEAIDAPTNFGVDFHEITAPNGATDASIETALGDDHLFDENTLCAIIAEMISVQEGGKEGLLLNNGYANLFYTSGLVVRVRWRAEGGKWDVDSWHRGGGGGWDRGRRVFAPGN